MVGPVTNAAWMRPGIDVAYRDVAEMPAFARPTRARIDGQSFEINMLAMYCVAMRRDVFERIRSPG